MIKNKQKIKELMEEYGEDCAFIASDNYIYYAEDKCDIVMLLEKHIETLFNQEILETEDIAFLIALLMYHITEED